MDRVEERLRRMVEILEEASVDYAVVGGNAVRTWVAQVDEAAVRATNDVDILIRPDDLPAVIETMAAAGFSHRQTAGVDMFVQDPNASARDAIHVVLAGRMVRPDDIEANPDLDNLCVSNHFRTLPLDRLVRMKLNSFRLKDRVHLLDMLGVGLIDSTWVTRFPPPLAARLQDLIDNPDQ